MSLRVIFSASALFAAGLCAPAPEPTAAPDVTATFEGNPFEGVDLWANEYYASEIHSLAVPQLSGALATAAAKVAEVPTFQWM
jgi:cellulose 1,4-beta-cellobiosidase